jgi:hypothetical protein
MCKLSAPRSPHLERYRRRIQELVSVKNSIFPATELQIVEATALSFSVINAPCRRHNPRSSLDQGSIHCSHQEHWLEAEKEIAKEEVTATPRGDTVLRSNKESWLC